MADFLSCDDTQILSCSFCDNNKLMQQDGGL